MINAVSVYTDDMHIFTEYAEDTRIIIIHERQESDDVIKELRI